MRSMASRVIGFFFKDWIGGLVAGAIGLLGLVTAYQLHNAQQRSIGARNAVTEIDTSARDIARKASAARRAANAPGALERLRKNYCRDC